jgi:uncharacterized protein (TIGR02452 family)
MSFDFAYTPSRGPDRSHAKRQGEEAVAITNRGSYVAPSGKTVAIAAAPPSVEFRPEDAVPLPSAGSFATKIAVLNGTSLAAAHAIALRGDMPSVLNFASAKNPGGGFLRGARAQEESLARSSALYEGIRNSEMYAYHRASGDCLYSDWMIYSPAVPVFRDDHDLLEEPYLCAFLTSAAPNAGVVIPRQPERKGEVEAAMRARVRRSLAISAAKGDQHLVLGAWGCGVFKNSPLVVADAYANELAGAFAGVFASVTFAVLDWSEDRHFIRPFVDRFA